MKASKGIPGRKGGPFGGKGRALAAKSKRRHRWSTFASMMNGTTFAGCDGCGIAAWRWPGGRQYLWRDGKWRTKCPPCEPVEVSDD